MTVRVAVLPAKPAAPTIAKADFEAELRRLVQAFEEGADNERCIECSGCERCKDCTFCKGSKGLSRSHYCVDSQRLTECTHCRASRDLLGCSHCVACDRCTQCSYCTRSVDCSQCTYCFGCVGLTKKDFHILNKPYDRRSYFAIVERLARELGLG